MSQLKLQRELARELIRCGFTPDVDGKTWKRGSDSEDAGGAPDVVNVAALRNDQLIELRRKYAAEAQPEITPVTAGEEIAESGNGAAEGGSIEQDGTSEQGGG